MIKVKIISGSIFDGIKIRHVGEVIEVSEKDYSILQKMFEVVKPEPETPEATPEPEKPKEVEKIPEPPAIPEPEPVKEVVKKVEPQKVVVKPIRKDVQIITNKKDKK